MKRICALTITGLLAVSVLTSCSASGSGQGDAPQPQQGKEAHTAANKGSFDIGRDISVVSRESGSGTRGAFIELFGIEVKDADGNKKDMTTKEAVIADKTDIMMTNIASDPYAIGYISVGSLNNSVKALEIDSAAATFENIKSGTYAIQRPFNIAVKEDVSELGRDFISFILSKEGQGVVAANKYIPIDDNMPS